MQKDLFGNVAREDFHAALKRGEELDCPCCGRFAKIYKRQIHAGIALQLIKLYKTGGLTNYVHNATLLAPGSSGVGDFSKAAYWGLIEEKEHEVGDLKSSGYWMLTMKGSAFVRGVMRIPKYVLVYDHTVLGFEGDEVSIRECLKNMFNYSELMSA